MRRPSSRAVAFGGILASVAVVLQSMGGLIPMTSFVIPIFCILIGEIVYMRCGSRIAWAWYATVAILSLLLGPDKEAAAVYAILGYYPIVKPKMDKLPLHLLWELLLFNTVILFLYGLLGALLGISFADEYAQAGFYGMVAMLLLGNITFFLLNKLLGKLQKKLR